MSQLYLTVTATEWNENLKFSTYNHVVTRSLSIIFIILVTFSNVDSKKKCCHSKFHVSEQVMTYTLTTVLNKSSHIISHVFNFGFYNKPSIIFAIFQVHSYCSCIWWTLHWCFVSPG